VQRLVCRHGQVLQAAAAAEVEELLARPDLEERAAKWVPATPPRRPAAWPKGLQEVVASALAAESPTPPAGVSGADWDRVLGVGDLRLGRGPLAARVRPGTTGRPAALRSDLGLVSPGEKGQGSDQPDGGQPQREAGGTASGVGSAVAGRRRYGARPVGTVSSD